MAYFHARELAKMGEQVMVFCPKSKQGELEGMDFKINYLQPILRYGNAAWVPQLRWKLQGFDAVHLHYPFFGGAEAVYFWKKKNPRKKLLMTYHMDTVGSGWLNWFFRIYKRLFLKRVISASDKIFVSTQDYARTGDLAKFLEQDPEKFVISNLGVDVNRFSPAEKPKALVQKFGFTPQDFILVFVGGLDKAHYFKGLDYLFQAIKKLANKNIKLVVVGDGELGPEYEARASELGLGAQVRFVGGVANEELADYYRLCDAHVFPSIDKSEAYGLVALEAAACAKPVVASNLAGVRQVVLDEKTGFLVEPKNVDALAEKIDYFFKNPEMGERLGRFARERIENEFTWKKIVEKLRQYY